MSFCWLMVQKRTSVVSEGLCLCSYISLCSCQCHLPTSSVVRTSNSKCLQREEAEAKNGGNVEPEDSECCQNLGRQLLKQEARQNNQNSLKSSEYTLSPCSGLRPTL